MRPDRIVSGASAALTEHVFSEQQLDGGAAGRAPRETSDAHLVALCRAGDRAAFEAVVGRYRPALLCHCRQIAGDASAQDAVQQAFIDAWRALTRGGDVRDLRAWLFTIAHRAALRAVRDQRERALEIPPSAVGGSSAAEQAERSARARETLAAIAELPPPERDALVWTSLQGRGARDIAHALGVSDHKVRQLVYRARARTRASIQALIPPVFATRVLARIEHGAARAAGGSGAAVSATSPSTDAMLSKLAAGLAAAALLATPLATVHVARHGGGVVSRTPVNRIADRLALGAARSPLATRSQLSPKSARSEAAWPAPERGRAPAAPTVATGTGRSTMPAVGPHSSANAPAARRLDNGASAHRRAGLVAPPESSAGQVVEHVTSNGQSGGGVPERTNAATGAARAVTSAAPAVTQATQEVAEIATHAVEGRGGEAAREAADVEGALPALPSP
jgi:RNA polymerase sigma factor (sigma-70 family)